MRYLPLALSQSIDLEITFSCGQIFRWRREAEWWCGTLGGTALALRCRGEGIEVRQAGEPLGAGEVGRFLALEDDLDVYPGHGETTSVGLERRTNPFLIHLA